MGDGSFYITLPSNASSKIYPENTISTYTTKLAKPIDLKGTWEVALTEAQYPHTWSTIDGDEGMYFIASPTEPIQTFYVKKGYYNSVNKICESINTELTEVKIPLQLHYDEVGRSVYVTESKVYTFIPGDKLARILGKKLSSKDKERRYYYADIKAGFYTLYVYTDIVQHQFVGDSFVQLLRTVEISGKNNEIITHSYTRPDYIPVCKQHIDSIAISICTDQAKPVRFTFGKSILRLHFRPRKTAQ